jgi:tape measure domain-containing protein
LGTSFQVGLEFSAKTQQLDAVVSKIQKFERDLGKLKGQNPFEGAERGARGAAGGIDRVGNSAKKAEGAIGGLRNALLTLGLGALVKTAFGAAAEIERTKKQLETLTGTAETAGRIYAELQRVNKQSPFELKDLTGAAAKLSAFGVETKDLVATTERLGKIAAGTGSEIGGIALAYGQVLAKGRLQGEELMQFQERGIGLGKELQKMLGVTGEEFADMTAKGKISSELVVQAIKNMTGETGKFKDAFVNTSETLDAKLSNLKDAFFNAAGALGKAFEPIFKWMINQLTYILNLVTDAINRWQGVQSLTPEKMDSIRKQADQEAGQRFPGFNPFSNAKGDFYNRRINELTDQAIKAATKGVAAGAVAQSTAAPSPGTYTADQVARNRALLAGGDTKPGGSRSSAATRLAGPKLPEYIDKEVLRKWLMSQGMGRTSGDFTNAGHKTPNHMLNAMDMGFTSSKYDHNYVQKTIEMERKLRATGAFGNQLFGPERDPKGHKDHLHVPTPGGKVKMNPALASMMGMSGGGQEGQFELAQNLMEADQERLENLEKMRVGAAELLANSQAQVAITEQLNPLERERLQTAEAKRNIEAEYAERFAELEKLGGDAAVKATLEEAKKNELLTQDLELSNRLNELRDNAISGLQEENALMEAKLAGKEEEYLLAQKIAELTKQGVDPVAAAALIQRNEQLKEQVKILDEVKDRWDSLAQTIEGEIGSAMSNAITGLIDGTMTAQQAFSQMFKNIGKAFIDMATQMIAKALVMKVMGILSGAFGGSWGGSPTGSAIPTDGAGWNQAFNTNLGFRASGGPVSPNSTYLVGENGPELLQMGSSSGYVVNNERTTAAMSRYSPTSGERAAAGGAGGGGGGGGTFTLETVVINRQEYATIEQVREMGQVAAKQGADGGHSRVMGDFRNKRSVRSRVGLR